MTTDTNKQIQDIENAIKGRGLIESMQKWDEEDRIRIVHPAWKKWVWTGAIAAMLIGAIYIIPGRYKRYAYRWTYRQYSYYFHRPHHSNTTTMTELPTTTLLAVADYTYTDILKHSQIENEEMRGADGENPIEEAVECIRMSKYSQALNALNIAESNLDEETYSGGIEKEDIEYLRAICRLGTGDRATGIKMLQTIADSDGIHQLDAKTILLTAGK